MAGHEDPSVPRGFFLLEDTNPSPENDIPNDPEKAFSPEDGGRGAHLSHIILV